MKNLVFCGEAKCRLKCVWLWPLCLAWAWGGRGWGFTTERPFWFCGLVCARMHYLEYREPGWKGFWGGVGGLGSPRSGVSIPRTGQGREQRDCARSRIIAPVQSLGFFCASQSCLGPKMPQYPTSPHIHPRIGAVGFSPQVSSTEPPSLP